MNNTAAADGDKLTTVVIVNPEFLTHVGPGARQHITNRARQNFEKLCAPSGLDVVGQRCLWVRTGEELRQRGLGHYVQGMPADVEVYGYIAFAAAPA